MKAWWCLLGVCLLGCSSQDPSSSDGGANGSADDAQPDAPKPSDGGCNNLANIGPVVQEMYVASDPPTGDGGTIADGTYACTAVVIYTGPDGGTGAVGATIQDTVAVNGTVYERVYSAVNDAGDDGSTFHQNGHFTLSGGSGISIAATCPTVLKQPFTSYDSDGTKLRFYAPGPRWMFEYTKQ